MIHLRKSVGWNELKAMMSNPQMDNLFSIICTENGKMIGFLSVVSNKVTDAYIQDVMVAPEFQGKGIGTELMNRAIAEIKARGIYMISVIYMERKNSAVFMRNSVFAPCFAASWRPDLNNDIQAFFSPRSILARRYKTIFVHKTIKNGKRKRGISGC